MEAALIRKKFNNFFESKEHEKKPSSSLIPHNDPTLLFANAGMNQFKDYFTGVSNPEKRRAVTIQKCVRAGGKHNDLENVGPSPRHHTFFEMLGNFSFGDYFKEDAIKFAWEFLTKELQMPKDKLFVTVHHSDDEAAKIWNEKIGIPLEKISKKGDKDNFWEMGEYGPCGPCSEIFYDHGPAFATPNFTPKTGQDFLDDDKRYVEIWNLVFMQYEKSPEGTKPLPRPSIDTGAGLERIAAAMQGKYWNYDTDLFTPIFKSLEKLTGKKYSDEKFSTSFRVVADHIRSCTMLLTDGIIPSNEGRGYVLRRIIRRAILHLKKLEAPPISFFKLVPVVFETLGMEYTQNSANAPLAEKILELEEKKFLETLELGLKYLNDAISKDMVGTVLKGDAVFKLYDTYGFPVDLTEVILHEKGLSADIDQFNKLMKIRKEESRKTWKGGQGEDTKYYHEIKEKNGPTLFVGYGHDCYDAKLIAKKTIDEELAILVFDKTPFYGESGGQLGDIGQVFLGTTPLAEIYDTQKPIDSLHVHCTKSADLLDIGKTYTLKINIARREQTRKHHSATHLLQAALVKIVGNHVKQSGSSVAPDRLRFDFTNPTAVSKTDLLLVEKLINQKIQERIPVNTEVLATEEAITKGATALFGEKYGDNVRVLTMGDFSKELCGGTHVNNSSEIELFSIISEGALSSGVRRIEAVVANSAKERLQRRSLILEEIESAVYLKEHQVPERILSMLADIKSKQKKIDELNERIQTFEGNALFDNCEPLKNNLVFKYAKAPEGSDLKKLSDIFMSKYQNGVLLLIGSKGDKLSVLLRRPKSESSIDCSNILKETLPVIQGKGGGNTDLAQGSANGGDINIFVNKVKELLYK